MLRENVHISRELPSGTFSGLLVKLFHILFLRNLEIVLLKNHIISNWKMRPDEE